MQLKKLITVSLAAFLTVSLFAQPGQEKASPVQEDTPTRSIRKGQAPDLIFPAPTVNLLIRPEDQANFDRLIWSPEKLEANYADVVIIDARAKGDYDSEHLPNAIQLHWNELVTKEYNAVPPDEVIAKTLADRGIDVSKTIIVYNDPLSGVAEETRLYWLLQYLGLTDSYVLNGGISYWKAQGHRVTMDKTPVTPVSPVAAFNRNDRLIISTEDLAARFNNINKFDARSDEEYAASRIPGAKHIWFKDFYHADGTYLTPAETRARISTLGFAEGDELATICRGGIRSTVPFVTLQTAGFTNVKNYCASFAGWTGTKQAIDEQKYTSLPVYD